jgi:hypothetical protein
VFIPGRKWLKVSAVACFRLSVLKYVGIFKKSFLNVVALI